MQVICKYVANRLEEFDCSCITQPELNLLIVPEAINLYENAGKFSECHRSQYHKI